MQDSSEGEAALKAARRWLQRIDRKEGSRTQQRPTRSAAATVAAATSASLSPWQRIVDRVHLAASDVVASGDFRASELYL